MPRSLTPAVFALALAGPAFAQEGGETEIPRFPRDANVSASPAQPAGVEESVAEVGGFDIEVSGYVRVHYQSIFEDPDQTPDVGRNDGFAMDAARLIVRAMKGPLEGYVSIDGAVDRFESVDSTRGRVEVGLKDAYVGYAREDFPWLKLRLGQFKPPFDAEELQSTREILFTDRAVESRGLRSTEGDALDGLSLDREVGAMVYGDPTFGAFGLGYYVAVSNGSGANRPLNDNDALAYTGRLELRFEEIAALGGAVNFNRRTTGDLIEDQVDEERMTIAADLRAHVDLQVVGLIVQAQFMQRTSSFPDVDVQPDRVEQGWHAALGVEVPYGFVIAYRYATLDPWADYDIDDGTVGEDLDNRAVTHHTIGLNWSGGDAMPLKAQLNYTIATEEDEARPLDNDRVDALVQVSF
ncbi:MAG: porin [bacterium]